MGGAALRGGGGQRAGEDGFGNTGNRNAEFQSIDGSPAAGALLAGGVHDDVDQRGASLRIFLGQNLGGDFNEVGIKVAGVPFTEYLCDLGRLHACAIAQQLISLADDLHIGILDTIVDHLHKVAGAVRTNVGYTRSAVHVGSDGLKNRAEGLPRLLGAAGHDGRTVERAFLATGDSGTDEVLAAGGYVLLAANGVSEQGIAAIDDDIAIIHGFGQLIDDGIGGPASLDHNDCLARALQGSHKVFDGFRGHKVAFLTVGLNECMSLFRAAVIHRYGIAVAGKVTGQIRTHDRQSHDANLSKFILISHAAYPTSLGCEAGING